MIEINRIDGHDPLTFEVVVREGRGASRHRVTLERATLARLTGGRHEPEDCVRAAFRFLLDREPKEAILPGFDLSVVARYFPEFERELPHYLQHP